MKLLNWAKMFASIIGRQCLRESLGLVILLLQTSSDIHRRGYSHVNELQAAVQLEFLWITIWKWGAVFLHIRNGDDVVQSKVLPYIQSSFPILQDLSRHYFPPRYQAVTRAAAVRCLTWWSDTPLAVHQLKMQDGCKKPPCQLLCTYGKILPTQVVWLEKCHVHWTREAGCV